MINNLKLGLKTIRYAHGFKGNIAAAVLMAGFGLLISATNIAMGNLGALGGIFMIVGAMFPAQLIYSLSMSALVQTAPAKKRMQTAVPAVITCSSMMVMYLFFVLVNMIMAAVKPEYVVQICSELVSVSFFAFMIMLYVSVCYKYFWVSFVMFFAVYAFCFYGISYRSLFRFDVFGSDAGSFLLAALLGLAVIAAGGFAEYGVSLLVYKAPMSKRAQAASLRKSL